MPLSAPFFCSAGRAPTSPSAHHWNCQGSVAARVCASGTETGSPLTS